MQPDSQQKVLGKIKKLLALAKGKGATPAEAASAAAAASRLMLKHQIAEADIEIQDENLDSRDLWSGRRVVSWVLSLAIGISEVHGCSVLVARGSGVRFRVIGPQSNTKIVEYLMSYLRREIDRLAKTSSPRNGQSIRAFRNAFRLGAAHEVVDVLRALRKDDRKEIERSENSTALARLDRQGQRLVKEYLEREKIRESNHRSSFRDAEGFSGGRDAARSISIRAGLNSSSKG